MRAAENCKGARDGWKSSKRSSEPFIKIGSEILTSPAYLDLSFSARAMLVEVVHFHNGKNNGSIWITKKVLDDRGFSKNTASKALKELRSHGFLFMTKKGGNIAGGCSWHALTWLPINGIEGQGMNGFVAHAYKKWVPNQKNNRSDFGAVHAQKVGLSCLSALVQ